MDNADQNIDDLSRKLKGGSNDLVVNEKFKIEEKLAAVEVERDNFKRELCELKSRYEKQETKLKILRREVESMNDRKRDVFAKFYLVKSQESVHDAMVESLKRQFDEQLIDILNGSASGNEATPVERTAAVSESTNMVVIPRIPSTREDQVAGSTSGVTGQINDDAPKGTEPACVGSHSMKNIWDRNNSQNFESILQCETQVRLTRLPMARSSGTVIRRVEPTSTTSRVTTTKTGVEMRHPSNAVNKRKASQAIVDGHRPKRTLRCTVCSKQYVSKPSRALCCCQYENQSD